ncbi:MAG: alcohol dehydrogenase catalytic domain-containing protein [Christensenellales bacterium]|jgi:2-desacetyl-2-hydroxyethyl bacteriochlorophyllide A dehydrogenase
MPETMDAIVFKEEGKYAFEKVPIPRIKHRNDVLIKVEVVSICGTDVNMLKVPQAMPADIGVVLGHECVGEIIETGEDVTAYKVTDRVTMIPNIECGKCYMCRNGHPNFCEDMRVLGETMDGALAQYVVVPENVLVKVKKDTPAHLAVIAEPLCCVLGGIHKIQFIPGQTALIIGAGTTGMLYLALLKASGASKILVSEPSAFRREMAKKMGATHTIDPKKEDPVKVAMQETQGRGVDVVIDAVGSLLPDTVACAKRGGKVLLFGCDTASHQSLRQFDIVWKGLTVYGNFIGPYKLFEAMDLVESGVITDALEIMVTHKLPLRDFGKALSSIHHGIGVEVVLYPWQE